MARAHLKCLTMLALVGVLGCDKSQPEKSAPAPSASAAGSPAAAVDVAIGKPLGQWALSDISRALEARGLTLGITQESNGDDGAGTTNVQLRAVAKRAEQSVEVLLIRYAGKDPGAGVDAARKLHAGAVAHRDGTSVVFFESADKELARQTALALLGKQPSG